MLMSTGDSIMNGQQIGYIRVSTVEQNTERQLDGVQLDKVFTDRCSGSNTDRPALNDLISYCRKDDTIHVHDISRMARNLEDLLDLVKELNKKGVAVNFHKENLLFTGESNPMQELMLSMLGAVYQFERSMLLERQREGIAKAKSLGKYKGRKASIDREEVMKAINSGLSVRKTATKLCIAPATVQRIKNEIKDPSEGSKNQR